MMSASIDAIINRNQAMLAQMAVNGGVSRADSDRYDELTLINAALAAYKRPRPKASDADNARSWFRSLMQITGMGTSVFYHGGEATLHVVDKRRAEPLTQLMLKGTALAALKLMRRECLQQLELLGYDLSSDKACEWDRGD